MVLRSSLEVSLRGALGDKFVTESEQVVLSDDFEAVDV